MKCPQCNKEGTCFYLEKKKRENNQEKRRVRVKRTDFRARCRSCKWEGIL